MSNEIKLNSIHDEILAFYKEFKTFAKKGLLKKIDPKEMMPQFHGELEVIKKDKDGNIISYNKDNNFVTPWMQHALMHLIGGDIFSRYGFGLMMEPNDPDIFMNPDNAYSFEVGGTTGNAARQGFNAISEPTLNNGDNSLSLHKLHSLRRRASSTTLPYRKKFNHMLAYRIQNDDLYQEYGDDPIYAVWDGGLMSGKNIYESLSLEFAGQSSDAIFNTAELSSSNPSTINRISRTENIPLYKISPIPFYQNLKKDGHDETSTYTSKDAKLVEKYMSKYFHPYFPTKMSFGIGSFYNSLGNKNEMIVTHTYSGCDPYRWGPTLRYIGPGMDNQSPFGLYQFKQTNGAWVEINPKVGFVGSPQTNAGETPILPPVIGNGSNKDNLCPEYSCLPLNNGSADDLNDLPDYFQPYHNPCYVEGFISAPVMPIDFFRGTSNPGDTSEVIGITSRGTNFNVNASKFGIIDKRNITSSESDVQLRVPYYFYKSGSTTTEESYHFNQPQPVFIYLNRDQTYEIDHVSNYRDFVIFTDIAGSSNRMGVPQADIHVSPFNLNNLSSTTPPEFENLNVEFADSYKGTYDSYHKFSSYPLGKVRLDDKITFSVELPITDQTWQHPLNDYTLKVAGLYCDAIFAQENFPVHFGSTAVGGVDAGYRGFRPKNNHPLRELDADAFDGQGDYREFISYLSYYTRDNAALNQISDIKLTTQKININYMANDPSGKRWLDLSPYNQSGKRNMTNFDKFLTTNPYSMQHGMLLAKKFIAPQKKDKEHSLIFRWSFCIGKTSVYSGLNTTTGQETYEPWELSVDENNPVFYK